MDKDLKEALSAHRRRRKKVMTTYSKSVLEGIIIQVAMDIEREERGRQGGGFYGNNTNGTLKGKGNNRTISRTTISQMLDKEEILGALEEDFSQLLRKIHAKGIGGRIIRARLEAGI